jgi:hypothetical protein
MVNLQVKDMKRATFRQHRFRQTGALVLCDEWN